MLAHVLSLAKATVTNILTAVSAANTAAATSAAIDLAGYEGNVAVVLNLGAVTGTIAPKVQASQDGTNFYDLTSGTNTLSGTQNTVSTQVLDTRGLYTASTTGPCRYIKFVGTIATGPSLISVTLVGHKKVTG